MISEVGMTTWSFDDTDGIPLALPGVLAYPWQANRGNAGQNRESRVKNGSSENKSPSETLKPVVWSTLDFASVSGPESQHVDGAGPRLLPLAPSKDLTVTVLARSLERNAECYEPRTVIVFGPEEVALH